MAEVLPKRKHPKNPKCFQWLVEEGASRMAMSSFEKHQAVGSWKMDRSSATAMLDAMEETGSSTDMQLFDKDCALDKHLDDVKELPPWMKKAIQDGHMSEARSAITNKRKELKDKFVLGEEEEGFQKVNKL